MTGRNRAAHPPRPSLLKRRRNETAFHVAVQQIDAIFSPVIELLLKILKLSAIVFPVIAVFLLISFSQSQSIPLPITTLGSSVFLLVYGGLFSVVCAAIVLSIIYPPLVVAADPHLNELSSRYPLFQTLDSQSQRSSSGPSSPSASAARAQSQGWLRRASSRVQQCLFAINRLLNNLNMPDETKKSINFLLLGFFGFLILMVLSIVLGFIAFWFKLTGTYLGVLLVIMVACSIFGHYKVLALETTTKFLVENFFTIIFMNLLLYVWYFFTILLIGKFHPNSSAVIALPLIVIFFIVLIVIILLLIGKFGQFRAALSGGVILLVLLLATIGFGRSAQLTLRALNVGGNIPAQIVVKPEACGVLKQSQAIEDEHIGLDGKLVSCTTKTVRVVFNVGDTVYFRSERMKQGENVPIQYPEDILFGLGRQHVIGTQDVAERKNQQSQE